MEKQEIEVEVMTIDESSGALQTKRDLPTSFSILDSS